MNTITLAAIWAIYLSAPLVYCDANVRVEPIKVIDLPGYPNGYVADARLYCEGQFAFEQNETTHALQVHCIEEPVS
mgnify:FL=1